MLLLIFTVSWLRSYVATAWLPHRTVTYCCASARLVILPIVRLVAAQLSALTLRQLWPNILLVWPAKRYNSLSPVCDLRIHWQHDGRSDESALS